MRIAVHVGSRVWGGAERAIGRLFAGLQQRGHEVLLFCNEPGHLERFSECGLAAELLPLRGDVMLPDALRFGLRLRRYRPAVLVVGTYKKLWLAGIAARLARVPRVLARVGLQSDVARNAKYRFTLAHMVDAIIVNSSEQAAAFLDLPGWNADRVHVIYNYYVPPEPGDPARLRLELGLARDVPVIGAVARLAQQKRLDRFIDVLASLPDVHGIIAGDGPLAFELAMHAAALDVGNRVHALGERPDVADVLAALDLFVLCSDREGMSNAMLEALAAGVPVVSTPVSGAAEALGPLQDGIAPGIIVQPEELTSAIWSLLSDPALRRRMSEAGIRRFRERFAPAAVLTQWEAALAEPD